MSAVMERPRYQWFYFSVGKDIPEMSRSELMREYESGHRAYVFAREHQSGISSKEGIRMSKVLEELKLRYMISMVVEDTPDLDMLDCLERGTNDH